MLINRMEKTEAKIMTYYIERIIANDGEEVQKSEWNAFYFFRQYSMWFM